MGSSQLYHMVAVPTREGDGAFNAVSYMASKLLIVRGEYASPLSNARCSTLVGMAEQQKSTMCMKKEPASWVVLLQLLPSESLWQHDAFCVKVSWSI